MMIVMSRHATTDEGKFYSEEQLEEAGNTPTREMEEAKMSKGEVEQKLSEKTAEL
jgi:hypothetical protein